ncbi:MAG TPA: ATP-dependent DNA helicase RecQ [Pyrinomonadaceae bacterium]|jgi:ATP-dependent DNA helicase RecQ|nr:ATP-dependent DNA helicase RecQ [Pyrinomonadaceae bacterium]
MQTPGDAIVSLQKHFGFQDFREGQREVIATILSGKDAMVVMPTGSGKSLCYQLPAMMMAGATLVVSPLIALMKDQVDALQARGLPATFINSAIPEMEQRSRIESLRRGEYKLVYVAPERFRSPRFNAALRSINISLFAVDEAHCVSTWGHDFRPDYLRLKNIIESLGKTPTLALTATATPYVRSDIIQQLGLKTPQTFVSGFDRPNLSIEVVHTQREREKISRIRRLAKSRDGSGIIYTSTRKAVEQVGASLANLDLSVATYHAGMTDSQRIQAQENFMTGRKQIIVATNAFGMGIDKPDIRFVVHYQMPGSIEAYYQEIGRAGRDGLSSSCLLLFNYVDKNTHDFFIEGSYPNASLVKEVYDALVSTGLKRIELSAAEIGKRISERNDMAINSALYLLERAGHIERTTMGPSRAEPRSNRNRPILMLDDPPVTQLRVNHAEVKRRADLERRKLREMIEFCYAERCFRAYILDYFGDRHHARECGTCGNCGLGSSTQSETSSKTTSQGVTAEIVPRELTDDELLRVRKILACAKRMKGRFGKQVLAATLRGSASKNVLKARLNDLSTYGLLKDMLNYDIILFIEALVAARCLSVSAGQYPTVSITDFGNRVMLEKDKVELTLPGTLASVIDPDSTPRRTP